MLYTKTGQVQLSTKTGQVQCGLDPFQWTTEFALAK